MPEADGGGAAAWSNGSSTTRPPPRSRACRRARGGRVVRARRARGRRRARRRGGAAAAAPAAVSAEAALAAADTADEDDGDATADDAAGRWRKALLEYTTGQRTLPLPPGHTAIVFARHAAATAEHLPTAHNCFCKVDLPEYPSFAHLAAKLAQAIESECWSGAGGGGFHVA